MSFQNHRYDFKDALYLPTQAISGLVQGIRQDSLANEWLYQLTTTGDRWWTEDEVVPACPKCLSPIGFAASHCQACGFCLDD